MKEEHVKEFENILPLRIYLPYREHQIAFADGFNYCLDLIKDNLKKIKPDDQCQCEICKEARRTTK